MEDEIELYSRIPYTPGWYYTKFPGFWNVDCYKVFADYSLHPDKYVKQDQPNSQEVCVDVCMDICDDSENKNSKRKHNDSDSDL